MRIDHRKVHHKIKTLDRVRTYVYAGLACLVLLVILAKIQIETTSYAFAGNSPVGYFDLISPDGTLYGWSFDPSHSSVSNTVTISMDSPSNRVAQVAANLSRPDVNRVMGVVGNHGFSWKIPAQYQTSRHTWYVYGRGAIESSTYAALSFSPRSFINKAAVGYFDEIRSDGTMQGWSYDPDVSSDSNQVVVYMDGPIGQGIFIATTTANVSRPDVNRVMGVVGNHGFSWKIPAQYQTASHTWYVYGVDTVNTGLLRELQYSGKTFVGKAVNPVTPVSPVVTTPISIATQNQTPTLSSPLTTTAALPVVSGWIDHVSLAWIEGFACEQGTTSPVQVAVYASGVQNTGAQQMFKGAIVYRVATSSATAWEPGHAAACGGNKQAGFHIPTPSILLDRADHTVVVYTIDTRGNMQVLSGATKFNSGVLYSQEPIYDIDDHIVVNLAFPNSAMPAQEKNFYSTNHTLFLTYTNQSTNKTNPLSKAISCAVDWATGVSAPLPASQQRGPSTFSGACPAVGDPMTVVQAVGRSIAFVLNSFDFGQWNASMFIQQNWRTVVQTFRPGHPADAIRVSGVFKQPKTFPALDAALNSPDGGSNWYYVLTFAPVDGKQLWFMVPVFDSRKRANYPWNITSDGVTQTVFYKETGDSSGANVYVQAPLQPSSTFITPCPGSAYFSRDAYKTERTLCFSLSAAQLQEAIKALNQKEKLSLDTDPSHYKLGFFLINAEVWGIGSGENSLGKAAMALSVHDLRIESLFDGN